MCEISISRKERKKRLKWRCHICLLSGQTAFECLSTSKQKCFYCKRRNHDHRSLCQLKFGKLQHDSVKSTSPKEATQQHSRGKQEQTPEHKESASEQTEIEITYPQRNIECEYYLTRNDLHMTKLELAECKKETATLKDKMSKLETEKENTQTSIRGYTEIINQQTEEISQLKEMF